MAGFRLTEAELAALVRKPGYGGSGAARASRPKPRDKAEDACADIVAAGLPVPVREHRFHPVRRWRFDMAWPDRMLAAEIEGGVAAAGHGHHSRAGYRADCEKYNAAALAGWLVLRFTTDMVRDGEHVETLARVFEGTT